MSGETNVAAYAISKSAFNIHHDEGGGTVSWIAIGY